MWQAAFHDGTLINEEEIVDGRKIIHPFSEVLKNLEKLQSLSIVQTTRKYTVNMITGKFDVTVSGIPIQFFATGHALVESDAIENIRPIYFVREVIELAQAKVMSGGNFTGPRPKVKFTALGFQGNVDGANIKRYLAILPDGTFTIEDE